MKKVNVQLITGVLGGLLLPFLVIVVLNKIKFNNYTLSEFITALIQLKMAGRFIQFAAISNLALFFACIQLKMMYAARGVIGATLLLVALVVFLMI